MKGLAVEKDGGAVSLVHGGAGPSDGGPERGAIGIGGRFGVGVGGPSAHSVQSLISSSPRPVPQVAIGETSALAQRRALEISISRGASAREREREPELGGLAALPGDDWGTAELQAELQLTRDELRHAHEQLSWRASLLHKKARSKHPASTRTRS